MMSMTWEEFKKEIEAKGVKDTDEIWYIDISLPQTGDLHVDNDKELGFTVY